VIDGPAMTSALLGTALGASLGSAGAAAVDRWPRGESLARPRRSRCVACGLDLRWHELLPIVSMILLRGRCARCRSPIPRRGWVIETVSGALVGAMFGVLGPTLVTGLAGALSVALVVASATDLADLRIPHRLTVPLGAVVVPAALLLAQPERRLPVLGWGLVLPVVLFTIDALLRPRIGGPVIGGGDVRLLVSVLAVAALVSGRAPAFLLVTLAGAGSVAALGVILGRLGRRDRVPLAPFMLVAHAAVVLGMRP
jgi:leader peptidase (prepilin peptidase)/N-methyltransferase